VTSDIHLRDAIESDYLVFFGLQRDSVSAQMAAFGTQDPDAATHAARWKKGLADASCTQKAIVLNDEVVGYVASFMHDGHLEVTYWIARSHWGAGIATRALAELVASISTRPLYASAARDNVASLRVLQKCGFAIVGSGRDFASARGEEIDEVFLELG
jgi:RimJ/RimL family protein N-acetyltransferase